MSVLKNERNGTNAHKTFLDPKVISFLMERGDSFDNVWNKLKETPDLVTDVRCLQEVVYRYHMIGETALGYENAMKIRNHCEVLPITPEEIDLQEELIDFYPTFPPRELLHLATIYNNGITKVIASPEDHYREMDSIEVQNVLSKISDRV